MGSLNRLAGQAWVGDHGTEEPVNFLGYREQLTHGCDLIRASSVKRSTETVPTDEDLVAVIFDRDAQTSCHAS